MGMTQSPAWSGAGRFFVKKTRMTMQMNAYQRTGHGGRIAFYADRSFDVKHTSGCFEGEHDIFGTNFQLMCADVSCLRCIQEK